VTRIARWLRLPTHERRLAAAALVLLPLVRVSLRAVGFGRTRRWVDRACAVAFGSRDSAVHDAAATTERIVRAAAVHTICETTCLARAIVLDGLLRAQGLHPDIRLGAKQDAGVFAAHAWVECDGAVLDPMQQGATAEYQRFT